MNKIFTDEFDVRLNEVDIRGKVKPCHIFNWFQHVSSYHSSAAGYPVTDLIKKNLTWVVTRYHTVIKSYPLWRDKISVSTWRSGEKSDFAPREFNVKNSSDEKIVYSTSSFRLIDLETRRPVSPKDHLPGYPIYKKREIDDDFESVEEFKTPDFEQKINVRRSDLDINNHVNNTLYIDWAIESIPDKIFKNKDITELEIAFKKEAFYNDKVISLTKTCEKKDTFLHRIERVSDGAVLAKLKTKWT